MGTPASSATSYCSPSQMEFYYDWRSIAQLVSDDGTQHTQASLLTDANLGAILLAASGDVESACFRGGRYVINLAATPPINDLAALTGASANLLQKLVADIAFGFLFERRPNPGVEPPLAYQLAIKKLDDLGEGKYIFGLVENMTAGRQQHYVENVCDQMGRNTVTQQAHRYFGRRYRNQWNQ